MPATSPDASASDTTAGVPLRVAVVYGSVREERQGIRAARYIMRQLEARGHAVTLVDALEAKLPMLDKMFKEYKEGGAEDGPPAPEALVRMAETYRAADAFVYVTGEYNHSLPPALKNLIDHFMNAYFWRPAAILSYSAGSFGGVRAAVHLRAVLGEVGMVTIPSMMPVPKVSEAFDMDGTALDDAWDARSAKFLDELDWYANALRAARADGVPYD